MQTTTKCGGFRGERRRARDSPTCPPSKRVSGGGKCAPAHRTRCYAECGRARRRRSRRPFGPCRERSRLILPGWSQGNPGALPGEPGAPFRRPGSCRLSEERQDRLWRLVRDRERLGAELLLNLQRLQPRGGRFEIGIDQRADSRLERVGELRDEAGLKVDPGLVRTEGRRGVDGGVDEGVDICERGSGTIVGGDVDPLETEETSRCDTACTAVDREGRRRGAR